MTKYRTFDLGLKLKFHQNQRCDEPPAYDQVIGLPPSYDSVIILNGVQSRGASVVGSVRNSLIGTVRSLRRGSRGAVACGQPGQTDSVITATRNRA